MSLSPLEYLRHIYDELSYLEETKLGITSEDFSKSSTYQRAFARSFEIIGEAAKQLDPEFREKYPAVP